jgi:hypothetical protein
MLLTRFWIYIRKLIKFVQLYALYRIVDESIRVQQILKLNQNDTNDPVFQQRMSEMIQEHRWMCDVLEFSSIICQLAHGLFLKYWTSALFMPEAFIPFSSCNPFDWSWNWSCAWICAGLNYDTGLCSCAICIYFFYFVETPSRFIVKILYFFSSVQWL